MLIDRCRLCDTWVVTGTLPDLIRRMQAHELDAHGKIGPTRCDHRRDKQD
jgi:hypothetical protein